MIPFDVIITSVAEQDLLDLFLYITQVLHEPAAADRIYHSIVEGIRSLNSMPLRYPVVKEDLYGAQGIRHFAVENYILFYIVHEEKRRVSVIRILYKRREWQFLI